MPLVKEELTRGRRWEGVGGVGWRLLLLLLPLRGRSDEAGWGGGREERRGEDS